MKCYSMPVRMAIIKKKRDTCWLGYGEKGNIFVGMVH